MLRQRLSYEDNIKALSKQTSIKAALDNVALINAIEKRRKHTT